MHLRAHHFVLSQLFLKSVILQTHYVLIVFNLAFIRLGFMTINSLSYTHKCDVRLRLLCSAVHKRFTVRRVGEGGELQDVTELQCSQIAKRE